MKDRMQFDWFVTQKDVQRRLNEEELEDVEENVSNPNSIPYMKAPALEFESASTWVGVASASP